MNKKPGVKQSNLPLLFTNGAPTSLESMSLVGEFLINPSNYVTRSFRLQRLI
jgi:hypothetical protein